MDTEALLFQETNRIYNVLCKIAESMSKNFFETIPKGLNETELAVGDVLQHVLDFTRELLEAEKCAIFLVDMPERSLVLERISGEVDFNKLKDVATYDLSNIDQPGSGVTPWVFLRKRPFNARNFDELINTSEGHWKGNWDVPMYGGNEQARDRFQCVYMAPLLAGEKAIGVLKYENRISDKLFFDKGDERLIDMISSLITNLVISQRIERNRYDEILPIISDTLISYLDKPSFYEQLLEQCRLILSAEFCSLFLLDDEENLYLKCIVGIDQGKKDKLVDFRYENYRHAKGLTPWILIRKKSFNVRSYPDLQGRSEGHHIGKWDVIIYKGKPDALFKSMYSIPLIIGDEPIGVFKVENKNIPPYYFTESDERLFDLIGRLIAVAVKYEKARTDEKYFAQMASAAELGFLTAGISHEFNTYLQRFVSTAQAALDKSTDREVKSKLGEIMKGIAGASKLIDNFRITATRPQDTTNFQLGKLVEEIIDLSEQRFRASGVIIKYEDRYGGYVTLSPGGIQTIIINLVNNAFESVIDSPRTKVVRVIINSEYDKAVVLEVSDSGSGISSDQKAMFFAPFYTTKSNRMGIGLFLVRRLVNNMRGSIELVSPNSLGGTTVIVKLPQHIPNGE